MTHDDAVIISPPARPPRGEPVFVPRATTVVVVAALGVCVLVNAALLVDRLLLDRATAGSDAALVRKDQVVTLTGLSHVAFWRTSVLLTRGGCSSWRPSSWPPPPPPGTRRRRRRQAPRSGFWRGRCASVWC
ncbi:hypothetical protein ACFZAU_05155 [Streptomyces sp. NPDC008238]